MPRGRPRGSKNANTVRKELEQLAGEAALGQGIDPLYMLEAIAAYFYSMAEAMRKVPEVTLEQIASYYEKAARIAGMAAPYRHGKLAMIKLLGDPSIGQGPFKADATLDELKAELGKRVLAMAEAGLIDVASLPQPKGEAVSAMAEEAETGIVDAVEPEPPQRESEEQRWARLGDERDARERAKRERGAHD